MRELLCGAPFFSLHARKDLNWYKPPFLNWCEAALAAWPGANSFDNDCFPAISPPP
jgi:hypothetical protein